MNANARLSRLERAADLTPTGAVAGLMAFFETGDAQLIPAGCSRVDVAAAVAAARRIPARRPGLIDLATALGVPTEGDIIGAVFDCPAVLTYATRRRDEGPARPDGAAPSDGQRLLERLGILQLLHLDVIETRP